MSTRMAVSKQRDGLPKLAKLGSDLGVVGRDGSKEQVLLRGIGILHKELRPRPQVGDIYFGDFKSRALAFPGCPELQLVEKKLT
jgi:hypothetical protein